MISPKMQDAFNEQMKHEFYSSYLYLSMSAYCETANLPGFARWMRAQAREEVKHAMKIFDHLLDRGGRIQLHPLERPPVDFKSPPFQQLFKRMAKARTVYDPTLALYELFLHPAAELDDRPCTGAVA